MKKQTGLLKVEAVHAGQKLTLDPVRERVLQVAAREVSNTIPCGFRQDWVSGEREGHEFRLTVGAAGSPWMTFEYKGRGYCINVESILDELFAFADEGEESHG